MIGKIFDLDSPLMRFLLTAWDILVLNFLTLICMLPVITIGPALKALAFCSLKIVRGKDGNIAKYYFKNFTMNFWQTVGLGLLFVVIAVVMAASALVLFAGNLPFIMVGDAWIYFSSQFSLLAKLVWGVVAIVVLMAVLYMFPMQGRFKNKLKDTIKNSFWASLIQLPKSLLMLLCWLFLPACALFITDNFTPVIFLYGLSLPAYLNALIIDPLFASMEERINKKNGVELVEDPFEKQMEDVDEKN